MPQVVNIVGKAEQERLANLRGQAASGSARGEFTLDRRENAFDLGALAVRFFRKGAEHLIANSAIRDTMSPGGDWEFWIHTRQFSQEWQTKDLGDTELGRVRNRLKTKNGIGGSSCAICLQEREKTRRTDDIEEVRGTAWRANIVVEESC